MMRSLLIVLSLALTCQSLTFANDMSEFVQVKKLEVLGKMNDLGIEQGRHEDDLERAKFYSTLSTVLLTAGLFVPAAALGMYAGAYIGNRFWGLDEGRIVLPALTGVGVVGLAEAVAVPLVVSANYRKTTNQTKDQLDAIIESAKVNFNSESQDQVDDILRLLNKFDEAELMIRGLFENQQNQIADTWYSLGYGARSREVIKEMGLCAIRDLLKLELAFLDEIEKQSLSH